MASENTLRGSARWLCACAILMALNIVMSSFGIPVPGGHLYFNDIVIDTAAILLDPVGALFVGGIGAFLGDFFFYPAPMFVSLITRGLQAFLISVCSHRLLKRNPIGASTIGVSVGAVLSVVGYTLGRSYIYGTPEAAIYKLPYQILMAFGGAVIAMLLCWEFGLVRLFGRQDKDSKKRG